MGFAPRIGRPKHSARFSFIDSHRGASTALALLAMLAFDLSPAWSALTPEQETRKIAQSLKPISDQNWIQIAGERASQKYSIVVHDTLYDLSKRLFGDPKYWPKIWAINNGRIINPHLIYPGHEVAFLSGSGTSLPSVGVENPAGTLVADADSDPGQLYGADRSQEWRTLPHQTWEDRSFQLPPNIDPQGFDRSNKIQFKPASGFELLSFLSESEIPYLGEITGARRPDLGLILGDVAYIRALRELQVGQTYTLTQDPVRLYGPRTHRKTYSYLNVGKIRIISVRDGLFVGTFTSTFHPSSRGYYLIPEVSRVKEPDVIAGPEPLQANILLDLRINTRQTVQYKQVIIDRGADDGVKPGMIFRSYQHDDPATGKTITNSDFIIYSDFMVMHTYEHFCVAWALNGVGVTLEKAPVVLLTDITDLEHGLEFEAPPTNEGIDKELDDLERLDAGGELGDKEKRELKQLERWKEDKIKGEGEPELPVPPEPESDQPPEAAPQAEQPPEEAPATEKSPSEQPNDEKPKASKKPLTDIPAEESPSDVVAPPKGASPTAPLEPTPESLPESGGEPSLPAEPPPAPEMNE